MLMRHKEHGWHNASDLEKDDMKKNGWIESINSEYQEVIAMKKLALTPKSDIIEPQEAPKAKLGRPSKLSLGGSNGNSTNRYQS